MCWVSNCVCVCIKMKSEWTRHYETFILTECFSSLNTTEVLLKTDLSLLRPRWRHETGLLLWLVFASRSNVLWLLVPGPLFCSLCLLVFILRFCWLSFIFRFCPLAAASVLLLSSACWFCRVCGRQKSRSCCCSAVGPEGTCWHSDWSVRVHSVFPTVSAGHTLNQPPLQRTDPE